MLVLIRKRPSYLIGPFALLTLVAWALLNSKATTTRYYRSWLSSAFVHGTRSRTHNEVFSASTPDGRYFMIDFGGQKAMNPNIIPHPILDKTFVIVAQLLQDTQYFTELACDAVFEDETLKCINHAVALPIAPTFGDKCTGDLAYVELNKGPHDARVFYGPRMPYTIFGSNSMFNCFGQWIQDFRTLLAWGNEQFDEHDFMHATELQRPPPWAPVEKNWFLFFDKDDQPYVHSDVAPSRIFAKLDHTGAVGPDLSFWSAPHDEECMAKFMPTIGPELESIHQATNSLLITMCRRDDRSCVPDDTNTFVFTIFQHKNYFDFHAVYEPYLLVFEQNMPFKIHGISKKPFWIHGRKGKTQQGQLRAHSRDVAVDTRVEQEEMIYITSMSWKSREQKYHGYIDDVLFVAFGIEDEETAAIDVTAGDLFRDLGTC